MDEQTNRRPEADQTALAVEFNFEGKAVRTDVRDGETWFVAADVCDVLEIRNSRAALPWLALMRMKTGSL
jgi:prophage antirepressor-like protein